ncbi:O-antigen ligase family protein, partial [Ursidibacter sp. B-7004-1]
MLTLVNKITHKHITFAINILVALFFVTVLAFKKGYSYVPMTLAVVSIGYLSIYSFKFKKKWILDKNDKWMIFSFLFYFSGFLISAILHKDGFREIDNPSRVLLLIPLMLLFSQFKILPKTIFYAIPIGSAVTGLLAIYQKFFLGEDKAFTEVTHHIQSGNISVTLSMLSLAISIYWLIQKEYKLMAICMICSLLGIVSSAISGARGGWICLPFILITILFFYRHFLNKKIVLTASIIFIAILSAIASIPKFGVIQRYYQAEKDIIQYIEKNNKNSSLGARFDMWENALLGIKEKPLLGWGSKGYIELKQQQVSKKIMAKSTLKFNDTHNQYLDSWVKRGLLGFVGLLLVLLVPLKYFMTNIKSENIEIKSISILGTIHIIATMFYFLSQTFLGHNSGSIFYFFIVILFYELLKT